jgi:hypothetical protein
MRYDHGLLTMALLLGLFAGVVACPAFGQSIIDEWSKVQVPPPPELKRVTVDSKSTALW